MSALTAIASRFAHYLRKAPADTDRDPDGYIDCAGEPLAYWLPEGVTLAELNDLKPKDDDTKDAAE